MFLLSWRMLFRAVVNSNLPAIAKLGPFTCSDDVGNRHPTLSRRCPAPKSLEPCIHLPGPYRKHVRTRESPFQPQGIVRSHFHRIYHADRLLKFTAKQLNRQAAKAGKDEQTEKAKLKKVCTCIDMRETKGRL